MEGAHTRLLFDRDSDRFDKMSLEGFGILLDYSKNKIIKQTVDLLIELAKKEKVDMWRDKMLAGDLVNCTEERAVLHTALRNGAQYLSGETSDGSKNSINQTIERMAELIYDFEEGVWIGSSGEQITDVASIGISGSDLGPKMVTEALSPYRESRIYVHFVSNVDGSHSACTLEKLNPKTILLIVASKSFRTDETLTNAFLEIDWLISFSIPFEAIENHFIAVSSNIGEVKKFGISEENIFPVWGWVGGWYSLWPAMIAIYLGMRQFQEFLDGANEMDQQFKCADLSENMPVLLALLGIWYNNFGGYSSHALLPYDQHMKYFADYLQQPDMESNGKSVRRIGDGISYSAAPIVWGSAGTDSQHAYFQLLHQGTERTTCDFIVSATGTNELPVHHKKLLANCCSSLKP